MVKVADEEVDSSSCRSGEEGFAQNLFDGRGLRVHVGMEGGMGVGMDVGMGVNGRTPPENTERAHSAGAGGAATRSARGSRGRGAGTRDGFA